MDAVRPWHIVIIVLGVVIVSMLVDRIRGRRRN
jgi:hypothetical protein